MASAFGHYNGAGSQKRGQFTVTALGRWSSINKTLPGMLRGMPAHRGAIATDV